VAILKIQGKRSGSTQPFYAMTFPLIRRVNK
jgi:hypothetical protein